MHSWCVWERMFVSACRCCLLQPSWVLCVPPGRAHGTSISFNMGRKGCVWASREPLTPRSVLICSLKCRLWTLQRMAAIALLSYGSGGAASHRCSTYKLLLVMFERVFEPHVTVNFLFLFPPLNSNSPGFPAPRCWVNAGHQTRQECVHALGCVSGCVCAKSITKSCWSDFHYGSRC